MTALTIAHATEFSPEEQPVFEHALALACASRGRLFSVNAHDGSTSAADAPDAAALLERWGQSPAAVDHRALVHSCCDDPIDTLLDALGRVAPDLVVAGTHQRTGAARLFSGSRCEALLRNVRQPTLVFPFGARPFVKAGGGFDLRRIVIPIGDAEAARAALDRAVWLTDVTDTKEVELVLVFAGEHEDAPPVILPRRAGFTVRMLHPTGSLADAIAEAGEPCLIVMATRGPDSLGDSLLGTNTEQVLRRAHCPVLVTPI